MINSIWSSSFALADWHMKCHSLTQKSLGSATIDYWSLDKFLALATEKEKECWSQLPMKYSSIQGGIELRELLSKNYSGLKPENIIIFAGAQEAVACIYLSLLDPSGSSVLGLTPSYSPINGVAKKSGAELIEHPLVCDKSSWYLDQKSFCKKIERGHSVVTVNFPHNPTGFLPSIIDWKEIIIKADKAGSYLISDEVFRGIEQNPSEQLPPACELFERGISVGTLSKSYGAQALRIGWVACQDLELINKLMFTKRNFSICPSLLDEFIAKIIFKNQNKILGKNKDIVNKNIQVLKGYFETTLSSYFSGIIPSSGLVMLVKLLGEEDSYNFCYEMVKKTGMRFEPGSLFGSEYKNYFRLGLGQNSIKDNLENVMVFLKGNY